MNRVLVYIGPDVNISIHYHIKQILLSKVTGEIYNLAFFKIDSICWHELFHIRNAKFT